MAGAEYSASCLQGSVARDDGSPIYYTLYNAQLGTADRSYGPQAIDARTALIDRGWTISGDILGTGCVPFVTTWKTTAQNQAITIPTHSSSDPYNYTVDWGNGTIDTGQTGNALQDVATWRLPGLSQVVFMKRKFNDASSFNGEIGGVGISAR